MRSRWRGPSRLFSVLAVVAMLTIPTTGVAREPSAALDGVVSSGPQAVTVAQQRRVLDYWTPERMAAARPMPAPAVRSGGAIGGVSQEGPDGPPVGIAGSGSRAEAGSAFSISGAQPLAYAYPFPFTRYDVEGPLQKMAPYKAIGKMYFSQSGNDFVCSGASVKATRNIVFTAGHCISNGAGTFSTNVLFSPARRPGAHPHGRFPGLGMTTTTIWHFDGDLTGDFGAFEVATNNAGQTLKSRVGALGFAYNQSRIQHWNAFGYPAQPPFSGNTMVRCEASHAVDDTAIPGTGPDPMGIGCDMTPGSSGGPWIMRLRTDNWLNSVNSYRYLPGQPLAMYGPYFDSLANQVRCSAGGGGVGC